MNARQGGEFSWNTTHTPPGRGFGGGAAAPGTVENGTNFMPDLAYGIKMDPKMKVMLAGGYYDLATPYFEGVYEMRHLVISPCPTTCNPTSVTTTTTPAT